MSSIHRLDRYRFVDLTSLDEEDPDGDVMKPWPEPAAFLAALAPACDEVDALLAVPRSELDLAQSLVQGELLTSRGADYFPQTQLHQPCRLLFDVAVSRSSNDPNSFSVAFSSVVVGFGLAFVPAAEVVAQAQAKLEKALEAAGLSGLVDDEEEDDEEATEDDDGDQI